MINTIAVDDEPVALDIIRMHAAKVKFIDLKQEFHNAKAALNYLTNERVDLIFMDINMPGINGLECAALISSNTQIIFTTAHVKHALTGFDLAITDFLLKPINYTRFLQACHQAESRIAIPSNPDKEFLFVKDGYKWINIKFTNLLYIKGEDNYLNLTEAGKQTLVRMTMPELMNKLPENFIKVHKSYIVNTAYRKPSTLNCRNKYPCCKTIYERFEKTSAVVT